MTTERLYYDDSYTLGFSAYVVETATHKNHPALVLDRTYFYPEGGGQPSDTGQINGVRVLDVQTRESDRAVLHVLERALPDHHIEGQIDAARRFDHMQHHSGQHVLSQALEQAAHANTLSVHMSADSMTIDVDRPDIAPDEWLAVEQLANQIIHENRAVHAWFPEADELAALRQKLRKLPDVAGKVRIVNVGDFDITACGGTHVSRTGEIGLIKVVKAERRGESTRLEFRCGGRALNDYRAKNDLVNRLMSSLTVGAPELLDSVARLVGENKAMRSELKAAREHLAELEALALTAEAESRNGRRVVARAFMDRSVDEVRMLAQKVAGHAGIVALFGVAGDKAQLFFGRADDLTLDVVPLLRAALAALDPNARGGGRPNFAQGGGVPAALAQVEGAIKVAKEMV